MDIAQFFANPPASALWLLVGLVFLAFGALVGEPVLASLGIAALITAIAAITVSSAMVQVILWGILAIALAVVLRGMVPKNYREHSSSIEATVTETIPPGGLGLVSYEGSLWKARSQVSDASIHPGQNVYVVARQGLTLIVLPVMAPESELEIRDRGFNP